MDKYYNNDIKNAIMHEFVNACKFGTSKDCQMVVRKAKQYGITYDELCEYKRLRGD